MRTSILTTLTLVLVLCAGVVMAQEDFVDNALAACETEIETYCSQVTQGEGRLLACFFAHEDKLSGECSWALYEAAGDLEQFVDAIAFLADQCGDDLLDYCGDVQAGEGRVGVCLIEHKEDVSEDCRSAIDEVGLELNN